MEALLELKKLSIGFKQDIAQDLNAKLNAGSLVALMGINGVGKSCLLKTMAQLLPVRDGEIVIKGKNIRDYSTHQLAQVVSLVLTEKIQVDYLRVHELVALGRSPYTNWRGRLSDTDLREVEEVIKQVGMEAQKNSFFSELSDGQKQKILIARALAQQPQILILDEPTTFLDIPSKIGLMKLLKKITQENNMAILMSTHDLDLVTEFCDQVWLMGNDQSFNTGSPAELASAGEFNKHFYEIKS